MDAASHVVLDNNDATNDSFVYHLHHEAAFDAAAFWRLYNGLVALAGVLSHDGIDERMARSLHRIHREILSCFIRHLSGEEELAGFPPSDELAEYMERLELAMDGCFTGTVMSEDAWAAIHQLRNPTVAEEDGP